MGRIMWIKEDMGGSCYPPLINLVSNKIIIFLLYHRIDGILIPSSKFDQCQLVMKN